MSVEIKTIFALNMVRNIRNERGLNTLGGEILEF